MPYDLISGIHAARQLNAERRAREEQARQFQLQFQEQVAARRAQDALTTRLREIQEGQLGLEGERVELARGGEEREARLFEATFDDTVEAKRADAEIARLDAQLKELEVQNYGTVSPDVAARLQATREALEQRKEEFEFERKQAASPQAMVREGLELQLLQSQTYRNLIGNASMDETGAMRGPVFLPDFLGGAGTGQVPEGASTDGQRLPDPGTIVDVSSAEEARRYAPGTRVRINGQVYTVD